MPVGDCQRAFGEEANRDGIRLVPGSVAGLTSAGHLALPADAPSRDYLETIFNLLNGDVDDLAAGPHPVLSMDWVLPESHLILEVDEHQHFTSDRLRTFEAYPADPDVCFSVSEYKTLCRVLMNGSDRYRHDKPARGFRREGGRRAQRAYFDAVRDLAAPDLGWLVLRVPAGHGDGRRAYQEARKSLREWI